MWRTLVARPQSDNPASETIRIRVTPTDKRKLQRLAKKAGLSLSAYLIACGLGKREAD